MAMPKRFPDRVEIASVRAESEQLEPGEERGEVRRLAGRVMARRDMGKLVFLDLVDRSGRLQLLVREEKTGSIDLDLGDVIGVEGVPARTRRGEPSLAVESIELLAKNRKPLPDTFHGLQDVETRYRQRYLDLLVNEEARADALLRSRLVAAIRRYLDAQGFVEVETPILQPRYGGAFAEPFVTHYNALGADYYLRIATELYLKRLIVGGLERVYEIGKDFRNEGTSYKHQPEFTMLEWYEAYADYRDTMARMEELVAAVAQEVNGTTKTTFRGHEVDLGSWRRLRARRRARGARALDEGRAGPPAPAGGARRRHQERQDVGAARRPRARAVRRAVADRADDPPRLPDRALAVRPRDGRRPDDRRAVRVLRRRDGARERVQRAERLGGAGRAVRDAGGRA